MIDIYDVLSSDPEVVSGAVVLKGSRVPIEAIFLNLQDMSLDRVLENYPTIERSQAIALLELAVQELKKNFPEGW
jgi:uncharacterized protein (DUF433 family)